MDDFRLEADDFSSYTPLLLSLEVQSVRLLRVGVIVSNTTVPRAVFAGDKPGFTYIAIAKVPA